MYHLVAAVAGLALAAALLVPSGSTPGPQEVPAQPPSAADMAKMMAAAKQYTQPGEAHKALERFLGKWTTETRFFMGGKPMDPEKGTSEGAWLMEGRWLRLEWTGTMMGMPNRGFTLLGHDNFKKSYVMTTVQTMDTAMTHAEGDMDPSGKALLMYGTLDEYLTGEHDKMVKYVWRFPAADKMVLEVHDLPIGENNTKVVEVQFNRAK